MRGLRGKCLAKLDEFRTWRRNQAVGRHVSKRELRSRAVEFALILVFLVTVPSSRYSLAASSKELGPDIEAVAQCKLQHGIWRWVAREPKSSGKCIFRTPDAEKVCTDDSQCSTHECRVTQCKLLSECEKEKSGECEPFTGETFGCHYHFRKGVVIPGPCDDPPPMHYDSGEKSP